MEEQQSHSIVMQEKLRLLESQVAALISDVLLLKAWKSEMSKLWSPVIKQEPVDSDTTMEMSYHSISEKSEYVVVGLKQEVPTLEETAMEEGVVDTLDVQKTQAETNTAVRQSKEEDLNAGDVLESANQPNEGKSSEIAKPPVKEESRIDPNKDSVDMQKEEPESDGMTEHSKEESHSETDATAKQPKEGKSDVVTIQNTVHTQKIESNISELAIQPVEEESTIDPNKDSVDIQKDDAVASFSGTTAKQSKDDESGTAIVQSMEVDGIAKQSAEEESQIDPSKGSLDKLKIEPETDAHTKQTKESESHIASVKSTEVDGTAEESRIESNKDVMNMHKLESETEGHKSTEEDTSTTSVQDTSIATTVEAQKQVSKRSKRDSWIELIEEEEHALPVKNECAPGSGQVIDSSWTLQQKQTSVSSSETEANGAKFHEPKNEDSSLPALLAKLIKSSTDKRIAATTQKQKTEVLDSEVENNVTDKQKSVKLSTQRNQDWTSKSPLKDKNANITYTSSVEGKQKRVPRKEEEGKMEDVSVNIKDKKCATCQCKIPACKVSQVPEEDSDILEVIKKMNLKQLQKKYLDLHKRHEKLVNGICDPNCIVVPDDNNALLNAARDGDVDEAILLTFSDTMMSFCDEDGYLPLHLAVWSGQRLICRLLLGYNMPVNAKDNQGNTPLHFASRKGYVEICELLLEWNAAVNATNNFGSTPLHCAVKEGQEDVCCLLVSKGALVNLNDKWNNTALHMAACNGHLSICRLLVQHGADLNAQNNLGNTPLHNACKAGHLEVVQHLVKKGASPSVQCKKGKTPKEVMKSVENATALEWLENWEKRTCTDLGRLLSSF